MSSMPFPSVENEDHVVTVAPSDRTREDESPLLPYHFDSPYVPASMYYYVFPIINSPPHVPASRHSFEPTPLDVSSQIGAMPATKPIFNWRYLRRQRVSFCAPLTDTSMSNLELRYHSLHYLLGGIIALLVLSLLFALLYSLWGLILPAAGPMIMPLIYIVMGVVGLLKSLYREEPHAPACNCRNET